MMKGFYNLTSGMLTQQRNLNTIANNMVNASTAGYKADTYVASTFDEVMLSRVGNKFLGGGEEIGEWSYIRASSQIYTDFGQGAIEPTDINLDFAIEGDGFFAVQAADGTVAYTRGGSFSLDEEHYLCLPGAGRVLDEQGQPILLPTEKFECDDSGRIYADYGALLGKLGVYRFADNSQLARNARGLFTGAQGTVTVEAKIHWKALERSNIDVTEEMTGMITAQRALQSAAEVTRIYEEMITKATTELGRV